MITKGKIATTNTLHYTNTYIWVTWGCTACYFTPHNFQDAIGDAHPILKISLKYRHQSVSPRCWNICLTAVLNSRVIYTRNLSFIHRYTNVLTFRVHICIWCIYIKGIQRRLIIISKYCWNKQDTPYLHVGTIPYIHLYRHLYIEVKDQLLRPYKNYPTSIHTLGTQHN